MSAGGGPGGGGEEAGASPPDLAHLDCWVFDLDNTLYPAASNLFDQVDRRMGAFIVETLGLAPEEARALQKQYFRDYGTTLSGLMREHGIDPQAFLDYVHDIDLSVLGPAPRLGAALAALPGRKVIYTNGSIAHAQRVLTRLEIAGHFDGIVDIVVSDFDPKPSTRAFARMLDHLRVRPDRAAMVEDIAKNLRPAKAVGMVTVWLRGDARWAAPTEDDVIDHVVDDLADWLSGVAAQGAGSHRGIAS
jgi:putative hydrolase of the HAD superfamily